MTTSKHTKERPAGKEHIPLFPKGYVALRIVQLVLAVIIIGLCGYGAASIVFGAEILELFIAACTIICCIYYLVAEYGPPHAYNYWAILALDVFLVIFWLISFAVMAAAVAYLSQSYCGYYYCSYSYLTDTGIGILGTAAGLGAVEFALFITSLAIHSVMVHRHRAAGLHNRPGASSEAAIGMNTYQDQKVHHQQPAPVPTAPPYTQPQQPQQPQQAYQQPQAYPAQQQHGYPPNSMTPPQPTVSPIHQHPQMMHPHQQHPVHMQQTEMPVAHR